MADSTWQHQPGSNGTVVAETIGDLSPMKVANLATEWRKATAAAERQYWINKAYLANFQNVYWNEGSQQLNTITPDPDRISVNFDLLKPALRRMEAKLLKRGLVFEVQAGDSDDGSVLGARLGDGVLRHTHRAHNWEGLRAEQLALMLRAGTAVLCLDWDPKAGVPLGRNEITGKNFGTGDIVESVLSIGEVLCPPGTRDIEKGRAWIKQIALPPEEVRDLFDLKVTPPSDATASMSTLQKQLAGGVLEAGAAALRLTNVLTYYERPSNLGPGRIATVVNGEFVDGGVKPWPFPFRDRLNVVCARETWVEGRWYGDTILSAAISPQTGFNQSWSSIIEHMDRASNARLLVPEQMADLAGQLTDQPGEVVLYQAAQGIAPPSWIGAPQMPAWWVEQPDRLRAIVEDQLGGHDIPGNTDLSGTAVAQIIMEDDTPLGRNAKEIAEAWGRFATLVLEVYAAKVTDQRKARVSEPGEPARNISWTGRALNGQTEAVVPLDAVQPRNREAQFQMAMKWKELYPELPIQVFAKMADAPGTDDLLRQADPDVVRARFENQMMAMGRVCVPEKWDNHEKHIHEHNNERKSERYWQASTAQRELLDLHIQGHETLAAEEAGLQEAKAREHAALAAAAQGGEPPLPIGMGGGPDEAPAQQPAPEQQPQGQPSGGGAPPPPELMGMVEPPQAPPTT